MTFTEEKILVEFDGKAWEWLSIDDLAIETIVDSAKKQFGSRWQKRISEDLVQVLHGLDHKPGTTVKLELRADGAKEVRIVKEAPLTEANRDAVWDANVENESRDKDRPAALVPERIRNDPVGEFHNQLKQRWAYYDASRDEIDAAADKLRNNWTEDPTKINLALELNKLLSLGIDGHASMRGWRLEGRCLPFLIDGIGDRFVAFNADRNSLVDPDHPYIESIDGKSISEWCAASSELVAKGSKQLVQQRSLRNLRHIDHWRTKLEMPVKSDIRIGLVSADRSSSIEKTIPTADRKPIYGTWPRTESGKLDGNIGYLRIESMNQGAVASIRQFMPKFRNTVGLVVDVRGNGGGTRDALRSLFSFLMTPEDQPRVANVAKHRLHEDFPRRHLESRFLYPVDSDDWSSSERKAIEKFAKNFKPQWEPPKDKFSQWHYLVLNRLEGEAAEKVYYYDKPVVILCDVNCFSATDIFLAGLKGWRNVTLVGAPSSGGSARSVSFEVPGLFRARIASMASFQPDGKLYDGNGVEPDKTILPEPEFFVGGKDNALEESN